MGWHCRYCAAQLVTGTSERKQNKTLHLSACPTVYICVKSSWTIYEGNRFLILTLCVFCSADRHRPQSPDPPQGRQRGVPRRWSCCDWAADNGIPDVNHVANPAERNFFNLKKKSIPFAIGGVILIHPSVLEIFLLNRKWECIYGADYFATDWYIIDQSCVVQYLIQMLLILRGFFMSSCSLVMQSARVSTVRVLEDLKIYNLPRFPWRWGKSCMHCCGCKQLQPETERDRSGSFSL